MKNTLFVLLCGVLIACQPSSVPEQAAPVAETEATQAGSTRFDILLQGGTVVDGLGNGRFTADVGVRDDRAGRVDADSF